MSPQAFLEEAEIMHKLQHPKLVQLMGVSTSDDVMYIITELMVHGSLRDYLREDGIKEKIEFMTLIDMVTQVWDAPTNFHHKKIRGSEWLQIYSAHLYTAFDFQIADGMSYLEEKNFVHRDVRSANILVGENNIVKVADFGLARVIEDDEYTATGWCCNSNYTIQPVIIHRIKLRTICYMCK